VNGEATAFDGWGYQDGKKYGLRVSRFDDGSISFAIHRPAEAERAAALIFIGPTDAAQLASFLLGDS